MWRRRQGTSSAHFKSATLVGDARDEFCTSYLVVVVSSRTTHEIIASAAVFYLLFVC